MKKLLTTLAALLPVAAFTQAQTSILIDLSKPGLESSAETDPNGYHWNNIVPDPDAANGVVGWEKLTEEQKASYTNPQTHFETPGLLPLTLIEDAVDQTGMSTGVSVILTETRDVADYTNAGGPFGRAGEEYADELGALPTETGYPATATIDGFYVNWEFETILTLSGLNDAETYTLKMWGGYARETAPTSWIVNGDLEGEQTIETFNNTGANPEDYAIFENVSPVNGEITVQYEQGVENVGTPKGHWSTFEIIGNFDSVAADLWLGYPVDPEGFVNTQSWLGWVNVANEPWVFSSSLGGYVFIGDASGWAYVPRK